MRVKVLLPGMLGMFSGLIAGRAAEERQRPAGGSLARADASAPLPLSTPVKEERMRHFAVVGSGPAGFYTAEALEKAYGDNARIDILDRYPVPYGLIRFGVAPDHQSLKAVSKRYDKVVESAGVDFIGNVTVGRDVSVAELLELYDAVILATGAPHDRKLGIPGRGPARRHRLGRVRRLVQRPSRFRGPRSAARWHACGSHREWQCRPRLRANSVQDAPRVRRLGHRRPCARRARRIPPSARSPSSAVAARTKSR